MPRFRLLLASLTGLALLLGSGDAHAEAAALYSDRCASCHGEDGAATTPVGRALSIPSFAGRQYPREQLVKLFAESESHKRLGPFSDAELDALVAHLEALGRAPSASN
jgi:mono/diheme cytochrome c family protein